MAAKEVERQALPKQNAPAGASCTIGLPILHTVLEYGLRLRLRLRFLHIFLHKFLHETTKRHFAGIHAYQGIFSRDAW